MKLIIFILSLVFLSIGQNNFQIDGSAAYSIDTIFHLKYGLKNGLRTCDDIIYTGPDFFDTDNKGNYYFCDDYTHFIYKIDSHGVMIWKKRLNYIVKSFRIYNNLIYIYDGKYIKLYTDDLNLISENDVSRNIQVPILTNESYFFDKYFFLVQNKIWPEQKKIYHSVYDLEKKELIYVADKKDLFFPIFEYQNTENSDFLYKLFFGRGDTRYLAQSKKYVIFEKIFRKIGDNTPYGKYFLFNKHNEEIREIKNLDRYNVRLKHDSFVASNDTTFLFIKMDYSKMFRAKKLTLFKLRIGN